MILASKLNLPQPAVSLSTYLDGYIRISLSSLLSSLSYKHLLRAAWLLLLFVIALFGMRVGSEISVFKELKLAIHFTISYDIFVQGF